MIKNQKKGIIYILLIISFFAILSSSYAAPLNPGELNQDAVDNTLDGDEIILIGGEEYFLPEEISINKVVVSELSLIKKIYEEILGTPIVYLY